MTPKTETLVSALRILSVDIQSEDGVAEAVVAEAADRLTLMANLVARHIEETKKDTAEMQTACETMNEATETIQRLEDRIKQLESVINDPHALWLNWLRGTVTLPVGIGDVREYQDRIKQLDKAANETLKLAATHIKQLVNGGDEAIYKTNLFDREERWNKAKEAKP